MQHLSILKTPFALAIYTWAASQAKCCTTTSILSRKSEKTTFPFSLRRVGIFISVKVLKESGKTSCVNAPVSQGSLMQIGGPKLCYVMPLFFHCETTSSSEVPCWESLREPKIMKIYVSDSPQLRSSRILGGFFILFKVTTQSISIHFSKAERGSCWKGKDTVQRDGDCVVMTGQVTGEQRYLCLSRSPGCCQPGCTINILQKKADLPPEGKIKREKCVEVHHLGS